jgi:hypothetical protein
MDVEKLKATLYLQSALPLAKVLREEYAPLFDRLHYQFNAVVQFSIKEEPEMGTQLIFKDGQLDVAFGVDPNATVTFDFPTKVAFSGFMGGKMGAQYLPKVKNLWRLDVIVRVLPILLGLKILDPGNIPTSPKKKAFKVKMVLFFITNALSRLNKSGLPEMNEWTKMQPERIYQWTVKGGPAAYLRVKAGKTKSGRGVYKRRGPFVHMIFPDIEGAFKVLTNQAPLVEAVSKGFVKTEGSLEYSKDIGDFMQLIESMLQ